MSMTFKKAFISSKDKDQQPLSYDKLVTSTEVTTYKDGTSVDKKATYQFVGFIDEKNIVHIMLDGGSFCCQR